MKKGQVSIFILVVGVVILASVFLSYIKISSTEKIEAEVEERVSDYLFPQQIESYVEECAKLSAKHSILNTAAQGGFYNRTDNSLIYSFSTIPFYSKGEVKSVPLLHQLEEQLSLNIEGSILNCVNDFKFFKDQGYGIEFNEPSSKTRILENQVLFNIDFPIKITKEGKTMQLERFTVSIPSRYGLIYSLSDQISDIQSQNPEKLCVSCLADYGFENDLKIAVANFNNDSVVFAIIDEKVKIGNEDLIFMFAHSKGDSVA